MSTTEPTPFPPLLLDGMRDDERDETLAWWDALPHSARLEFLLMWDSKSDSTACYGHVEDGELHWHELPLELTGEFIEPDRAELAHDVIKQQMLEFVNNRQEIDFFLVRRSFHICRAHAKAREVIADGLLPAEFVCPLEDKDCPMRHILDQAPGESVIFHLRVKR